MDFKQAFTDAASDVADEFYPKGETDRRGEFLRDSAMILVKLLDNLKEQAAVGAEMVAQDNRGTQYPLYVIQIDRKRYVNYHDEWEGKERQDPDFADEDDICKSCKELYEEKGELPDDCDTCSTDAFDYYRTEDEFDLNPGIFLTLKACNEHIADNKHHYEKPRAYCVSAWRNPEMQMVQRLLISMALKDLPSYYR